MRTKTLAMLSICVAVVVFASGAKAVEPSPQYLHGSWTMDDAKNCGLPEFEHITFRDDGTMEAARHGNVTLLGFWLNTEDIVRVHFIASPARLDEKLNEFLGYYDYFLATMLVFDLEPDSFRAVGTIGDQIRKVTMFRCS